MKPEKPSRNQLMGVWFWMLTTMLFIIGFFVQDTSAAGPLLVYTVNYPLKYFAERIGGEHVRVEFPAPSDNEIGFQGGSVLNEIR